jgi:hypothetical protein
MEEIRDCNRKPAECNTAWRTTHRNVLRQSFHSHSHTVACPTATDYISYILCIAKHDADDDNSVTLEAPEGRRGLD